VSFADGIAGLPLVVDGYEIERLESGYERETMHVRLVGGGQDGLGEDVSPLEPFAAPPALPLAGEWTLGAFCAHLATLDQWPAPPEWEAMRRYRNWAFESAALDLAVRQDGRALPEILGRALRPVRFVNSLGLGDPPAFETLQARLDRYPALRFKLDADARWTPELVEALAATGAVDIVDFKGQYGLEVADEALLAGMYELVLDRFSDALLEDPHDLPDIAPLVASHVARVSYDAPIHEVADLGATAHAARTVNIKPSRIGSLAMLFAIYDHCERHGVRMYGGGMGELGVGRGQAQLLASMFHADAPNDIAPSPYNAPSLSEGLPESPLEARPPAGFRWTRG
jgi:L-alanine-DL-glutamate epimerase-like enolase superfamily enzyme